MFTEPNQLALSNWDSDFPSTMMNPTDTQLTDPLSFFDKSLMDPSMERELAAPMKMANEMLRRAGWGDMVTKPLQAMAKQEKKNLGPLNNIIKANVFESADSYSLHAGI
jgi:hypothetical protein